MVEEGVDMCCTVQPLLLFYILHIQIYNAEEVSLNIYKCSIRDAPAWGNQIYEQHFEANP